MKIISVDIERDHDGQQLCGSLEYLLDGQDSGQFLWTVDASPNRINVHFVQGSSENWDELADAHLGYLSDHLILEIARRRGLSSLESAHPAFAFAC